MTSGPALRSGDRIRTLIRSYSTAVRLDALAILGLLALKGTELCSKRVDGSLRQVKSFPRKQG
jgi:hypothetical protein